MITPKTAKFSASALIAVAAFALSACELTSQEQAAIDNAFTGPVPASPVPVPVPIPSSVAPVCHDLRHIQPEGSVSHKVDLLLVFDTSGSMNDDRRNISEGLDEFVRALPEDADYQVALMLAHGSLSPWSGRLFKYKSNHYVLSSESMSLAQIRTELRDNLINAPYDRKGSSEMGMFTVHRAMEKNNMADSKAHGFFRADAALAVVFISDENDVCATYPAGIVPVADTSGMEKKDHARDCGGITPQLILDDIKNLKGDRPFVIGGVVYNDATKVPTKSKNNGVTEEEYGYGYMDLIRLAGGVSADISGRHYEEGLGSVGKLVTIRLYPQLEFPLHNDNVDPSSIQVWVDGKAIGYTYDDPTRAVNIAKADSGGSRSTVDIHYCERFVSPSPSPSPSPTPSTSPAPEPVPSPVPSPTPTMSPTPAPTVTPSPEPSPSPSSNPIGT